MIKSMTGYGVKQFENDQISLSIEIKSLNSKFLDQNIRMPREFSHKEADVRRIIGSRLIRGKIALNIDVIAKGESADAIKINKGLFKKYFKEFSSLAKEVGASDKDIFKLAMHAPEVMRSQTDKTALGQQWQVIEEVLVEAIESCNAFREKEGAGLKGKLEEYVNKIEEYRLAVKELDPIRVEALKTRLRKQLTDLIDDDKVDENRFEQELIYYIEKLDIQEELVRLSSHVRLFKETLEGSEQGKKLNFVSQEMGREINTMGSKANNADIQKLVVGMKEELEKIKEQALNII